MGASVGRSEESDGWGGAIGGCAFDYGALHYGFAISGSELKATMRYLLPLLTCIATATCPSLAQANQAQQQGDFVVQLYSNSCTKFPGNNARVSGFAREHKYVRADERFSSAALRGKQGEVWGVPNAIGQFLLVLTGDNHCSAWARSADAKSVNAGFEKLVKGVARPGLTVKQLVDKVEDGAGGKYRQLGYFIQKDGAATGWVMLATTSESPGAEVQVRLTMSPSRP